jgi:hypothetical protein
VTAVQATRRVRLLAGSPDQSHLTCSLPPYPPARMSCIGGGRHGHFTDSIPARSYSEEIIMSHGRCLGLKTRALLEDVAITLIG